MKDGALDESLRSSVCLPKNKDVKGKVRFTLFTTEQLTTFTKMKSGCKFHTKVFSFFCVFIVTKYYLSAEKVTCVKRRHKKREN